jgi:hypothetical protein
MSPEEAQEAAGYNWHLASIVSYSFHLRLSPGSQTEHAHLRAALPVLVRNRTPRSEEPLRRHPRDGVESDFSLV